MSGPTDNETWVIAAGDTVIKKMVESGLVGLAPLERLVYCLWVADYGMRNAGDLDAVDAIYPQFQSDARCIPKHLSLQVARHSRCRQAPLRASTTGDLSKFAMKSEMPKHVCRTARRYRPY